MGYTKSRNKEHSRKPTADKISNDQEQNRYQDIKKCTYSKSCVKLIESTECSVEVIQTEETDKQICKTKPRDSSVVQCDKPADIGVELESGANSKPQPDLTSKKGNGCEYQSAPSQPEDMLQQPEGMLLDIVSILTPNLDPFYVWL